jgi:hypothetical protein
MRSPCGADCDRHVWFAENSEAQATLGRVRELVDEWERAAVKGGPPYYAAGLFATAAKDLRAALGESK